MTEHRLGYSFIIPAYNDAEGLIRHFDYFRAHTPDDHSVELIIVDDCSTDNTGDVLTRAELPDHISLVYHRMAQNGGAGPARNAGITLATLDRVMFLDADDLLAPCFFRIMRLAPLVGDVDFVMFKYHLSTNPAQRFTYDMHQVDRQFYSRNSAPTFPMQQFRLQDRPYAPATVNFPWNKLYRRDFLIQSGMRFPDLRMHEDITPNWQAFLRCRSFGVMDWAPPLITHYEITSGDRATQYIGEKRLEIYDELKHIEAEILTHEQADRISKTFVDFCTTLFDWMSGPLCAENGDDGRLWEPRYRAAAQAYWETSKIAAAKAKS